MRNFGALGGAARRGKAHVLGMRQAKAAEDECDCRVHDDVEEDQEGGPRGSSAGAAERDPAGLRIFSRVGYLKFSELTGFAGWWVGVGEL